MLNEVSGFFSIIFMNFLFSWVLVTSRFRFKKVKESIFLQFNFTLDDSLFFHIFLWISISFYFQIMIFFPFLDLDPFFSLCLQKIIIFFFVILPNFVMNFHFILLPVYDLFPFLDLDSLFSLILQKIMIFFPFRILIVFFFHFLKDYDPFLFSNLDCCCLCCCCCCCFCLFKTFPFNGH